MAVRKEWSIKYRAAVLERNPALQLLRMTEANDAFTASHGRSGGDFGRVAQSWKTLWRALNLLRDRRA
jgi:hypothetical protein